MARPQISIALCPGRDRLVIVRGRAFAPGCRLVFHYADGQELPVKPAYARRDLVFATAPEREPDQTMPKLSVRNPPDETSHIVDVTYDAAALTAAYRVQDGPAAAVPLRIVIVANPYYRGYGHVHRDGVLRSPGFFHKQLGRVFEDMYREKPLSWLAAPAIRRATQIDVIFDPAIASAPPAEAPQGLVLCALVASGKKIEASRRRVQSLLERYGLWADVVIVLTRAPQDAMPVGWFGTDNYARGGKTFEFDGKTYKHCYHSSLPGVVAFSRRWIRRYEAQHELLHALSAYNSGQVLDEYDAKRRYTEDDAEYEPFCVNKKFKVDADVFATYQGETFQAKRCEASGRWIYVPREKPGKPCIMRRLTGGPVPDPLIAAFMGDRIRARISRPF